MRVLALLVGLALLILMLIDAFETILQPRRVTHRFRYARLYYRSAWQIWRAGALIFRPGKRREAFLSIFGPLSLLGLFTTWVGGMIFGFALIHFGLHSPLHGFEGPPNFDAYLYLSGTTFFTLGYGDITPAGWIGRISAVAESGMGFTFLAIIVSYLPILYQAFSKREATISLMDARAGSPPSASELLLRLARSGNISAINSFLREWELWSGELLESQLSFPVLSFYRSQHDNQSWVAALATMLDTSALLLSVVKPSDSYQAQLTFAMSRHAAVDLATVLKTPPIQFKEARLSPDQYQQLHNRLREAGLELHDESTAAAKFLELRKLYEPFLYALSERFLFTLPQIFLEKPTADNWQRSSWMHLPPGIGQLPRTGGDDEHF